MANYCFEWGGLKWGKDYPGAQAFSAWLTARGANPAVWAANHPDAAACIGMGARPDDRPLPPRTPPELTPQPAPTVPVPPADSPGPAPAQPAFCFEWGGQKWGRDYPGWDAFRAWLTAHGVDHAKWVDAHLDEAVCAGWQPTPLGQPDVRPTGEWAHDVLAKLFAGFPSQTSIEALHLWADSEGMPAGSFNWLAATDTRPGSTTYNTAGVQRYPSYQVGVQVIVDKLSSQLYAPIRDALAPPSTLLGVFVAVNMSPWCRGCQGGTYPVALYRKVSDKLPDPDGGSLWVGPGAGDVRQAPHVTQGWESITDAIGTKLPNLAKQLRAATQAAIDGKDG